METEDFRKIQDALRDPLRRQAMRMIKRGMKKKEVALILGVHANSITNWVKKYNLQGTKGLIGLKRGVKSEDKKLLSVIVVVCPKTVSETRKEIKKRKYL